MQKIVISKFLPEKVYENNAVLAFELTGPYTPWKPESGKKPVMTFTSDQIRKEAFIKAGSGSDRIGIRKEAQRFW